MTACHISPGETTCTTHARHISNCANTYLDALRYLEAEAVFLENEFPAYLLRDIRAAIAGPTEGTS